MAEQLSNLSFLVFYRDYTNDVRISSSEPEPLAADRLTSLAKHLLLSEDNFLGIIDSKQVILQLYLDSSQEIVMEMLYPEATGCMQCRKSFADALQLLGNLPAEFGDDLLIGANYIG